MYRIPGEPSDAMALTSSPAPTDPLRGPATPRSPRERALHGWSSALARFTTLLALVVSATGVWIYIAPFSVVSQLQLLLHTLLGLVFVVPYGVYQVRHFIAWYRQRPTAVLILGYATAIALVLCTVSGVVLTLQAALGPQRSGAWHLVHLVTGFAAFALLAIHVALALHRRAGMLDRALGRAVRGFGRAQAAGLVGSALVVGITALAWPRRVIERPVPESYGLSEYVQRFEEYRGNPFAPTYAHTASGTLLDPGALATSSACGSAGCHQQIFEEWQPSAHRFSAMNPPFQAVQRAFAADRGAAETRYCAGCHDPISLFAGAKDIHTLDLASAGTQEGSSCSVCHLISKVDQRGNADYELSTPHPYVWEDATGIRRFVSDFLIRAAPRQHLADYDRNLLRTPEFCGACHKQFIPEALNRFGDSPAQNQYDEWRKSHWHQEDPARDLSCRDCHMRLVPNSTDPGRGERGDARRADGDDAHRHHGTIATNMFMPAVLKLPGAAKHVALTEDWIRGQTVLPEIDSLWPRGPVGTIDLDVPAEARPGEEIEVRATVTNAKAGHNLITGPLDFMRAWVHLVVTDADGRKIAEWGAIDPVTRAITDEPGREHVVGNPRDAGTLVLEAMPLDCDGKMLLEHELWRKAGGRGQRVIFPAYADGQLYRLRVPTDARGPLRVEAALEFRRYRQDFLERVVPDMERDSGVYQTSVTQDREVASIPLRETPETAVSSFLSGASAR